MTPRTIATSMLTVLLAAVPATKAVAEIRLPNLLTDHAVLQRDAPIHLWGWATPGANLTIKFHTQSLTAVTNERGMWNAWLMPEHAGGPFTLDIDGGTQEGTKQVSDLLVGDVWIASGQSNMEIPLDGFPHSATIKDADKEIASATNPNIRLLLVNHKSSDVPLDDVDGSWTQCTPDTARKFSAVAYFFGREIASKEHVPIGLIDSTWGGTPIDSWVSLDTLGTNPQLLSAFANRAKFADTQSSVPAQIAADKAADAAALAAGKPKPKHPWHPFEASWMPAGLYNGMIAPLEKESVKGFLWYQGESDSGPARAPHYSVLFPALIQDWRMHFRQGNLPFLFVQISSFDSPGEDWGMIRDAQRRTLYIDHTAMAVSLDVGNPTNVHPADKQTVAARLALAARAIVYGERIEYGSPLFREATTQQGAMRVWFDNANGLNVHSGTPLGFEVAGDDRHFVPANAKIEGDTVLVEAPGVPNPRFVRYAWSNVVDQSLYNAVGLPASTFTSEEFFPVGKQ
jgi:sialate O-acetylesterase